jgi:hypothetical protein
MTRKKTFVLRLNQDMMDSLEKWAADDFRSINGQLEWIIQNALKNAKRLNPEEAKQQEIKNSQNEA